MSVRGVGRFLRSILPFSLPRGDGVSGRCNHLIFSPWTATCHLLRWECLSNAGTRPVFHVKLCVSGHCTFTEQLSQELLGTWGNGIGNQD